MSRRKLFLVDKYNNVNLKYNDPRYYSTNNNDIQYEIPVIQTETGREEVRFRPSVLNESCCQPGYVGKLNDPSGYSFVSKDYPYHRIYINTKLPQYKTGINPQDNYY